MDATGQGEASPPQIQLGEHVDLESLLTAAAWQDSLLQSYRALLLSSQTVLFSLGAALFVAELLMDSDARVYAVAALVIALAAGGSYANRRLQQVVLARGKDVSFWHEQILTCEKTLPVSERPFELFKIHQQQRRDREAGDSSRATAQGDADVHHLIGPGFGHTRRVIDRHLADMLLAGWISLAAAAVVYPVIVAVAAA